MKKYALLAELFLNNVNPLRPIPPFSDGSIVASLGTLFIEGLDLFYLQRILSILPIIPRDGRSIRLPFLQRAPYRWLKNMENGTYREGAYEIFNFEFFHTIFPLNDSQPSIFAPQYVSCSQKNILCDFVYFKSSFIYDRPGSYIFERSQVKNIKIRN